MCRFTKHTLQEKGVFPCFRGSAKVGREAHEPGSEPSLMMYSGVLVLFLNPTPTSHGKGGVGELRVDG